LQSAWFWKKSFPTEELKSVDLIVNQWLIPFNEAHCNLALNVAINREGRIDQNALDRLAEIGKAWKHPGPAAKLPPQQPQITTANLAMKKKVRFSSYYDSLGPDLCNDDDFSSFWILGKGKPEGWIEVLLGRREAFNTAILGEPRSRDFYGDKSRIKGYRIQYWDGHKWADAANGSDPAEVQVVQFDTVTASRVRLFIEAAADMPAITEFGLYNEPGVTATSRR
jgi:alpha-L-fucosidase